MTVRQGAGREARGSRRDALPPGDYTLARIMSAAFSPIIIEGALVLPPISVGMIEASTTRNPSRPCTRNYASANAAAHQFDLHQSSATLILVWARWTARMSVAP